MKKPENLGVVEWLRTPEVSQFIRANHSRFTNKQLADALGLRITNVRTRAYELGLYRMRLEYWTEGQIADLRALYTTRSDREIVAIFQERYPKNKPWTCQHLDKKRAYLQLKRTPHMLEVIHARLHGKPVAKREYQFKAPAAVGERRIFHPKHGKKSLQIKRADGHWRPAGPIVWQQVHGPIPTGHKVYFKDGDPSNCEPENLGLIKISEMGRLTGVGSQGLSDRYCAAQLVGCRAQLPKAEKQRRAAEFLQQPTLLATKRNHLLLLRELKQLSTNGYYHSSAAGGPGGPHRELPECRTPDSLLGAG